MSSRVLVAGGGRLATALAGGLRAAGEPVVGLWARRSAAAAEAAARAGVSAIGDESLGEAAEDADVVFVAVSDRAIAEVAGGMRARGVIRREHVVLHGSGALAADDALAPLAGAVRGRGTFHLLRAIPDGAEAIGELAGTCAGIEGDEAGREQARALARSLGCGALELGAGGMAAYHAAAAIVSNFAVALLDVAVELAGEAEISADAAAPALAELARGSLAEAGRRGTERGLTGPIRRGDAGTVARHLDALGDDAELGLIYRALGRRALAIARRQGDIADADFDAIAELLRTPQ